MLWATWARPALRQIKDCGVAHPHVASPPLIMLNLFLLR